LLMDHPAQIAGEKEMASQRFQLAPAFHYLIISKELGLMLLNL
jgi:hypothetical protein